MSRDVGAPGEPRAIRLKAAHYWELDARCRRTRTAQQAVAIAMQELREAEAAQNELVTKLARAYTFEPTNAQFGLNDKAQTMTLIHSPTREGGEA